MHHHFVNMLHDLVCWGKSWRKKHVVHTLKNSRNFILVLKNTGSHLAVSSSDLLSLLVERLSGLICFFMTKNEAEINYVCHTSIENKKTLCILKMLDQWWCKAQSCTLMLSLLHEDLCRLGDRKKKKETKKNFTVKKLTD